MKDNEYLSDEELMNLIAEVEENEIVHAPFYLKESIMDKVKEDVETTELRKRKQSANIQFLSFSFKVTLATAAAIAVLFLVPAKMDMVANVSNKPVTEATFTEKVVGKSNEFSNFLNRFSNQIIGKEDFK